MNANELRLNNFVNILIESESRAGYFKSGRISANDIQRCCISPTFYQPIKIDEFWLKGFKLITNGIHWYTNNREFELIDTSFGNLTCIKYNHNQSDHSICS